MPIQPDLISFHTPRWLSDYVKTYRQTKSLEQRMRFVIEASRLNTINQTGGPFAAGVFNPRTGNLISLGVNLVTSQGLSVLHAEIVAISLAQEAFGTYDLGASGQSLELVTSTEPCAMCYGAIPWSGIREVACGASDTDARAIGFDEGAKLENWTEALEQRGISVKTGVEQDEAKKVLESYKQNLGHIYNSRETD